MSEAVSALVMSLLQPVFCIQVEVERGKKKKSFPIPEKLGKLQTLNTPTEEKEKAEMFIFSPDD